MNRHTFLSRWKRFLTATAAALLLGNANGATATMAHGGMMMDETGMVMNANHDTLPKDCPKVSADVDLVVHAGHKYAQGLPGKVYAFDKQQWEVPGCARLNVTFVNDDQVRHQFMIHGLPGYIYPDGMFHMELYGKGELQASFIVPSKAQTYLVHCEVPQHMEKGMKAQLLVNGGGLNPPIPKPDGTADWRAWWLYWSGWRKDLPSIPGISEPYRPDLYVVDWTPVTWLVLLIATLVGVAAPFLVMHRHMRKRKPTVAVEGKQQGQT